MQASDAHALAELAHRLSGEQTTSDTIELVTASAVAVLDADSGSAMLLEQRPKRVESTATTSSTAARADHLQLDGQTGPCWEAARVSEHRLLVDDTRTEHRWPMWSQLACDDLGIRSVLSVPLRTKRQRIGALNLYASGPGRFDRHHAGLAVILARHASIAVDAVRQRDDLQRAVESRTVIGQALGLLMERYGLDEARAFATLRRYSQDRNVKLREVAEQLIATRALPDF